MINFNPNQVYAKMIAAFENRKPDSKLIICNEGGARAGKTWAFFYFLVWLCDQNRHQELDIYIMRDTLINCRDKTLLEFKRALKQIGIWQNTNFVGSPKPAYNLFGQRILFRGMEDETESYPSDILFFNEALDMKEAAISDLILRNRKLVIIDWNPKFTDAELFNYKKRDDTVFIKSTYKDNIDNLLPAQIKEIESYNPEIPHNVETGTASQWKWKVYGLGERANREGLVFPNVTWIDSFPTDIEEIGFGMDFGIAHNTALVKVGIRRKPERSDLFIQKLFYAPTPDSNVIGQMIQQLKEKHAIKHIWCDNNQPGWISDLRNNFGIQALLTKKFPGSRKYWIDTMNRFNIHIVKDVDLRKEQENFCYRVVDGIQLSETIDKYDDGLSAAGYATVGNFRIDKI